MMSIASQLVQSFKDKNCKVTTEHSVRLSESLNSEYVPDIVVLCDKDRDKRKKNYVLGAPTLVVEIWSPSNSEAEKSIKRRDYLQAGVKEVWEVYPQTGELAVYCKDLYTVRWSEYQEGIDSLYFPDIHIDLSEFINVRE